MIFLAFLLQFTFSDYQLDIQSGTLRGVTGDGYTITIPNTVIDILPNVFSGIPAIRLSFETGSLISSIGSRSLNGSRFQEIAFPEHYLIANSNLFQYLPTLLSITYRGPVHTIQAYAYNGCPDLTQITIQDRRVLYRGVLTFCSKLCEIR